MVFNIDLSVRTGMRMQRVMCYVYWVVEHLSAPDGVLVVDETGFIKKGQHSAGVQRQYSGTAGRVENCQIGVFLCYVGKGSSAFIDRALYLPKTWIADPERCRQAGIPDKTGFSSKPELARQMLAHAFDEGIPAGWVTADCVYGGDRHLRLWLEEKKQPFVLAVPCNESLWCKPLVRIPNEFRVTARRQSSESQECKSST